MKLTDHQHHELTLVANASPLLGNDGRYRGVLTSFEDITALEQNKMELSIARDEANEANRAKSEFLARMSHEIRTPMNAILGFADLLRKTNLSEKQKQYLDTIASSGGLLVGIIDDILEISTQTKEALMEWKTLIVRLAHHMTVWNFGNMIDQLLFDFDKSP